MIDAPRARAALLALAALAPATAAQIFSESAVVTLPGYERGGALALADLDGDPWLDLLIADGNTIWVRRGSGPASFASGRPYAVAAGAPRRFEFGDLDGDGHTDVVAVVKAGVSVHLGDGAGGLGPGALYSTPGFFGYEAQVADMDGDDMPDLVVSYAGSFLTIAAVVEVFAGNGDGTFEDAVDLWVDYPKPPASIVVADLDGDGDQDVALDYAQLVVATGDGTGAFEFWMSPENTYGRILDCTHIDADPFPDLVYRSSVAETVGVAFGQPGNLFGPLEPVEAIDFVPAFARVADVDRDGTLDLVSAERASDQVFVMLGLGDGSFGEPLSTFTPYREPGGGLLGDVTGDGLPDLILGFLDTDDFAILINVSGNAD